jgi:FkbM family methyltransferase
MSFFKLFRQVYRYITESPSNKGQKAWRIFLALLWQVYKRTVGLPIISKLDNGANFILLPNSINSTGNIYVKTYEAEYIYFLRKQVIEGGVLLDIGAHMGLYTLLLKDKFDAGFCFEPSEDNFKALRNNLTINDLQEKFKVFELAVSDTEGTAVFEIDGQYSGTNSIKTGTPLGNSFLVKTVTIDGFMKQNQINGHVGLVKVDTEGHEEQVLKGAKETLLANPECMVIFENSSGDPVIQLLRGLSFKIFMIDKNGNLSEREQDLLKAYNLIAVGPEHPLVVQLQ